jgi:hypothetical protein
MFVLKPNNIIEHPDFEEWPEIRKDSKMHPRKILVNMVESYSNEMFVTYECVTPIWSVKVRVLTLKHILRANRKFIWLLHDRNRIQISISNDVNDNR